MKLIYWFEIVILPPADVLGENIKFSYFFQSSIFYTSGFRIDEKNIVEWISKKRILVYYNIVHLQFPDFIKPKIIYVFFLLIFEEPLKTRKKIIRFFPNIF